jgi:hypothetical protein
MKIFSSYFWHNIKYQISAWFNPRQKWLTKTIPNTWCDKVTLIPNLMFTCLIHYVEDEEGLQDEVDWSQDLKEGYVSQEYINDCQNRDALLRQVYNYVKTERPMLKKQHDDSYPATDDFFIKNEDGHYTMKRCEELYGMPFEEAYAETNRLEKLIEENDLWAMNAIVKYHQHMWT